MFVRSWGRWRAALVAVTIAGLCVATPAVAGASPAPAGHLAIGTWSTDLEPWLPNQQAVIDTIAQTDLDVLGLQGVWTESAKNAILADPRIAAKYPYSFYPDAAQSQTGCPEFVPRQTIQDYVNSVVSDGVDPRELEQPSVAVSTRSQYLAVNLALISQPCLGALVNSLQELPPGADPSSVIDRSYAGTAPAWAHGGSPGQLILSDQPITNTKVTPFDTYQIRRVNAYATVGGIRIGFAAWPADTLEDFNPDLAPLQTGDLQPELSEDAVQQQPDVLLGSLNSGPDYQSTGYDILNQRSFVPAFSQPTYCPAATHGSVAQCVLRYQESRTVPASIAVDNIFANTSAHCRTPGTFATTTPASDHIGLSAVCALNSTPVAVNDSYSTTGAGLAVAAPGVLGNDTDGRGDPLTAALVSGPAHAASFGLHPDGSFAYTPAPGFTGSDSFSYAVHEDDLVSATATATISVVPGAPAAVIATSGSGQAQTAGQPFAAPLVATVNDAYGVPVPGQPVVFTVSSGSATFAGNTTAATGTSNGAGVATSPVLTAGRASGPVTVTASTGAATPATFTETVIATSAARADLQVKVTAPASVARNSTFTATVTVTNAGPNAASSLLTAVTPGSGLTVVTAPGGTIRPGVALYPVPSLASGATLTYTITLKAGPKPVVRSGLLAASLSVVPDPKLSTNVALTPIRIT